ncbi:unnamed protein product [Adineta steineri]|uniref:NHL repeat containing protein n=2 Tax=Adineta steineri TaxID=433720 RepID=A0A815BK39_9BILA|nr:unnamed protein product [Adineta steineri]
MNNRVGVEEFVEVNSNTTRFRTLSEHFRKRKLMWIIVLIVFIDIVIIIPTILITWNHRKMEKVFTTEITTAKITSTITITTEITTSTTTEITSPITTTTTTAKITTAKNEQILFPVIIDNNTKWKQTAVTVAGGNERGSELNQLNLPIGFYVDNDDDSIYIADCDNHRIVRWESGAKNGEIVAGRKPGESATDVLKYPTDVILDKEKEYLIICDGGNQRVMRWSRQNSQDQQIFIPHIVCYGLAIDNNGDIYISELVKHQVRRFQQGGDTIGTVVAGGNGEGIRLNQFDRPEFIFVDEDHTVYVVDYGNSRVMKWMKNATEGIRIIPGQASDMNPSPLGRANGAIVDHMGNIYVSTTLSNQVTRWLPDAIEGTPVVGEIQMGSGPTQLKELHDLSFDRQGNIYVVDRGNNRIQKFIIDRG